MRLGGTQAGDSWNNVTIRLGHDGLLEVVDLGATQKEIRSAVPRVVAGK